MSETLEFDYVIVGGGAGLTIGNLPSDVFDAVRTASKEVMDEAAKTDDFLGKITKSYYDYVTSASKYKELYDAAFEVERSKYLG